MLPQGYVTLSGAACDPAQAVCEGYHSQEIPSGPLLRGLSGLRFRAMGGVGQLHGLGGYPRLASGRGARGGEANIRLQQARCSVWRDNHVGTTEMKSHPTSTGMKHPLVPRVGESVQEAGSELEEEQKGQDRQRYRSVPQALHYHLYWTWTL